MLLIEGLGNVFLEAADVLWLVGLGNIQCAEDVDEGCLGLLVTVRLDEEGRVFHMFLHTDGERLYSL